MTVINDVQIEPTESVIVTLSADVSYAVGTPSATVLIADDDGTTVRIAATANGAEPATNGQFTISRGAAIRATL